MQTKLVVAGDSFAQFHTNPERQHWAQMIAPQGAVESIGYPAADISTTTFLAVQRLLRGDCTHMLFFVTSFNRQIVHKDKKPKSDLLDRILNISSINVPSFYNSDVIPEGIKCKENDTPYRFLSGWWRSWAQDDFEDPSDDSLHTFVSHAADFQYIHDRVSNLSFLNTVAKRRRAKIIYVTPFSNTTVGKSTFDMLPECKVFDYMTKLNYQFDKVFETRDTHHSPEIHAEIAKCFNRTFPIWLEIDK